jgi:hypothetical protein
MDYRKIPFLLRWWGFVLRVLHTLGIHGRSLDQGLGMSQHGCDG